MSFQEKATQTPESQSIEKTLVCRHCDGQTERLVEENRGTVIRCSNCGIFGDADEILQAARDYFAHRFVHGKIDDFQRRLAADTSHLKNVIYTAGKVPPLSPPDFIFR